jgi:membrane-bound lytic murein transglycosylase MltF
MKRSTVKTFHARRLWNGFLGAIVCTATLLWVGVAEASEPHADEILVEAANKPWTGDLSAMVERGFVRVLTVYSPIFFSPDGIEQKGIMVEVTRQFEAHLQKTVGKIGRRLNVIIIPVARNELIPRLIAGRGDIAAANLTITEERQRLVDFSIPAFPNISELVVTGSKAPAVKTFDDLAKTVLHVRPSSSYFGSVTRLNAVRRSRGKSKIPVREANENLEDSDLLDLMNTGVIPAIILDSHKAKIFAKIFKDVTVHKTLAVNTGGDIAWAFRKGSPELKKNVDAFWKKNRKGTLFGNIMINRYLNVKWMNKVLDRTSMECFEKTNNVIKNILPITILIG